MKRISFPTATTILALCLVVSACNGMMMGYENNHPPVFAIPRGGGKAQQEDEDPEAHRATKAILHAVTAVEDKVHKILDQEVDTLFHGHERESAAEQTKKAVKEASQKVKTNAKAHYHPAKESKQADDPHHHPDHGILHSVEAAEKAVLHAIEQEVDVLFHGHEKTKETVKTQVLQKAEKEIRDHHQQRRKWLSDKSDSLFEDYAQYTGL